MTSWIAARTRSELLRTITWHTKPLYVPAKAVAHGFIPLNRIKITQKGGSYLGGTRRSISLHGLRALIQIFIYN